MRVRLHSGYPRMRALDRVVLIIEHAVDSQNTMPSRTCGFAAAIQIFSLPNICPRYSAIASIFSSWNLLPIS